MKFRSIAEINFNTLTKGKTYFPSPKDWRENFLYFLLVDRFNDDIPESPKKITAPRTVEAGQKFQGGTIKGITKKLHYLKSLGCNAIWVSPVFKNRQDDPTTYHGYGIQNFIDIDPRFGTIEDLQELVKEAHAHDMYIILDIIFNHTGDNWYYPGGYRYNYSNGQQFPFGGWREIPEDPDNSRVFPQELQNPDFYKREGEIQDWFNYIEDVNGDFFTLKELDLNNPKVLSIMIDCYKFWIAVADIDGFRIDTVKHMEYDNVAIFANAIHEFCHGIGKHNFFLYGEVVAGDEILRNYVGRNTRLKNTDERFPSLDACLDFPLYFVLDEIIKGKSNAAAIRNLFLERKDDASSFGDISKYFVTFVDNHDQMIRPYRRFASDAASPKQSINAIGFLLTSLGIPCIYYGTEQGFNGNGNNDAYVRECMFPAIWGAFNTSGKSYFKETNEIFLGIKAITTIRNAEPALVFGRQYFREISGNGIDFGQPIDGKCTLAYSRILDTTELLVAINLDGVSRNDCITIDSNLTPVGCTVIDLLTKNSYTVKSYNGRGFIQLSLGAYQFAILKKG